MENEEVKEAIEDSNLQPDTTGPIRDLTGKFLPGVSGNPKGRTPGSLSLVSMLRQKLLEIPQGDKRSYAEKIIENIVHKAVEGDDLSAIKDIIDRIDGKARETVQVDSKEPLSSVKVKIVLPQNGIGNAGDDSPTEDAGNEPAQEDNPS